MITVAIVEDHQEIRDSLALLINATEGYECPATYSDCESAIEGIEENLPDVVLMDIGLPGMSGIEGIKKIKQKHPDIDFIILSIHENDENVFESLCSGATGYLTKETPQSSRTPASSFTIPSVFATGISSSQTVTRQKLSVTICWLKTAFTRHY